MRIPALHRLPFAWTYEQRGALCLPICAEEGLFNSMISNLIYDVRIRKLCSILKMCPENNESLGKNICEKGGR